MEKLYDVVGGLQSSMRKSLEAWKNISLGTLLSGGPGKERSLELLEKLLEELGLDMPLETSFFSPSLVFEVGTAPLPALCVVLFSGRNSFPGAGEAEKISFFASLYALGVVRRAYPSTSSKISLILGGETTNFFRKCREMPRGFAGADVVILNQTEDKESSLAFREKTLLDIKFSVKKALQKAPFPQESGFFNPCREANLLSVALDEALHKAFPDRDSGFIPCQSSFEPTSRTQKISEHSPVPWEESLVYRCTLLPHISPGEVLRVVDEVVAIREEESSGNIEKSVLKHPSPWGKNVHGTSLAETITEITKAMGFPKPLLKGFNEGDRRALLCQKGLSAVEWCRNIGWGMGTPNRVSEDILSRETNLVGHLMATYMEI